MPQDASKQELPPGTVSALNPQAGGLYQLTPEDEAIVNSYAKQRGLTQAEAVRTLLQHRQGTVPDQRSQPSVMEKTLGAIEQAQALGVASSDPNDVINSMGRGVVIKSLAKGLNGEDGNTSKKSSSFDDLKEMMYLRIMGNLAGVNDNNQGSSSIVQEMRNETEKLRQDLKDSEAKRIQEQKDSEAKRQQEQKDAETRRQADIEKIETKMREMVFEKKIQTIEEKSAAAQASISQEIKNLSDRVELYGRIPQTAAVPGKDAVSELEEIGGKLDRIKKALAPMFPQALAPTAPGLTTPASPPPSLKNADGSTDYLAAVERIGGIVVKGIEALGKKPPVAAEAAAQPAQPVTQQTYTERRMGLDEYADYLLSLKERTPEQQQWLTNYQAHLEREQAKLRVSTGTAPEKPVQHSTELPAVQPYRPPAEQPAEPHTPDAMIGEGQIPDQEQPGQTDTGPGSIDQPSDAGHQQEQPEEQPGEQPAERSEEQPPDQPAEEDTDVVEMLQKAEVERAKRLQGMV